MQFDQDLWQVPPRLLDYGSAPNTYQFDANDVSVRDDARMLQKPTDAQTSKLRARYGANAREALNSRIIGAANVLNTMPRVNTGDDAINYQITLQNLATLPAVTAREIRIRKAEQDLLDKTQKLVTAVQQFSGNDEVMLRLITNVKASVKQALANNRFLLDTQSAAHEIRGKASVALIQKRQQEAAQRAQMLSIMM